MFQLGDRNEAEEYASKRRAIRPALYNGRRLKERPRPTVMSNSTRTASNLLSQSGPQNQAAQNCVASSANMVHQHQQSQQLNAIATATTNASAAVQINMLSSAAGSNNQQTQRVTVDAQIVNSTATAAATAVTTNTSTNGSPNQNKSIVQIDVASSSAAAINQQLNVTSQSVASTTPSDDHYYDYDDQSNHSYDPDGENILPSIYDTHNSTVQFDGASTSSSSSTPATMQSMPLHNITNLTLPNVPQDVIAAGLQFIRLMTNSMANNVIFFYLRCIFECILTNFRFRN